MNDTSSSTATRRGRHGFRFRYAAHLGYRDAASPLFRESVGSLDPESHVAFAAEAGFAGVQYALAMIRPPEERARVAAAMRAHGLEAGCMIYAPMEIARRPLWSSPDPADRALALDALDRALEVAAGIGSPCLAVLSGRDAAQPLADQQRRAADLLALAAERARAAGVVLGLEPISERRVPGLLFNRVDETLAVVKAVDSPALRLIFDTGHVHDMEGEVARPLAEALPWIDRVQLADQPGRVEPGAGEIAFPAVLNVLASARYGGLVELEHGWSNPTRKGEAEGLERLMALDAAVARAG